MSSNDQNQPGLAAAHAQYAKGAAVSAVGAVTGSEAWKRSGAEQQADAVNALKAASENRDSQRDGYGKAEEIAGKLTGCEGMKEEGAASKK